MPNPAKSLRLTSPAKLNVFLEILGKRDDGFHELETVMLRTSLCDLLQFQKAEDGEVTLNLANADSVAVANDFPLDDSNLIIRAAAALQQATGTSHGVAVTIDKRIPTEAGLAGGSSNAATTLLGLNRLWDLKLSTTALHALATSLGSDVNFFMADCRAAVCRGRGERVEPISIAGAFSFVVARPLVGNSTPKVFAGVDLNESTTTCELVVDALRKSCPATLGELAFNRLTESAQHLNPAMNELLHRMNLICDRPAFMSGSGSTCFVIARSPREARRLLRQLSCLDVAFLDVVHV